MGTIEATRQTLRTATAGELETLRQAHEPRQLAEGEREKRLATLGSIAEAPEVFQPRLGDPQGRTIRQHVETLAQVVRAGRALDPILVYPVAGFRVVLDGHLRLRAYREAGLSAEDTVPVEHFSGTVLEARLRSLSANSKDKLPLSSEEKYEAAWGLMKDREGQGKPSYAAIIEAAQVSKGLLSKMGQVLEEPDALPFDPRAHSWKEVKRKQKADGDYDSEWEDRLADKWAGKLKSVLGDRPNTQDRVFWKAVERAYPRLYKEHSASIREMEQYDF